MTARSKTFSITLYVLEKVRNGLDAADTQGTIAQEEVEERLQNGSQSRMVAARC